MQIEFKETVETKIEVDIVIEGKKCGDIKAYESFQKCTRFHAAFSLPGLSEIHLLQGHGDTRREAFENAITETLTGAAKDLEIIRDFVAQFQNESTMEVRS